MTMVSPKAIYAIITIFITTLIIDYYLPVELIRATVTTAYGRGRRHNPSDGH